MTKSAMIRARMNPQLKDEVDDILDELGLSATQAITLFYQQIRLQKGIPFDVRIPSPRVKERESTVDPSATFPAHVNRSTMNENALAYKAMHPQLVQQYLGQYVAICNGQLVDADCDPVALLQRVREKYPNQIVLRRQVERLPEQELRMRHPKAVKAA
jgi:DNA-damage-inducible protein J